MNMIKVKSKLCRFLAPRSPLCQVKGNGEARNKVIAPGYS